MNKDKRNSLKSIISKIEDVRDILEGILREEEEVFDNIPENLQASRMAEDSENAIDYMNNAIESLNEAIEQLEEI